MIWLIGIGGSLGAAVRYSLGEYVNKGARNRDSFPKATWIINCSGSFLFGLIVNFYEAGMIADWVWFFGGFGFCGAYTTFSTFGYETLHLIQLEKIKLAIIYVVMSVVIGSAFALLGLII